MSGEIQVNTVGNLTADPELKFSKAGMPWARFTVAVTPREKNRDTGQWEDGETLFLACTAFRGLAENIADSLSKGMQVMISGKMKLRAYTTQDGRSGVSHDVMVDACGPSLERAKAQVTKVQSNAQASQDGFSAPQGGQPTNYGGQQGQANSFSGRQDSQWEQSGFDSLPTF